MGLFFAEVFSDSSVLFGFSADLQLRALFAGALFGDATAKTSYGQSPNC